MKKLLMAASVLMLASCSVFATEDYSSIPDNGPEWMEIGGKNYYEGSPVYCQIVSAQYNAVLKAIPDYAPTSYEQDFIQKMCRVCHIC